MCIIWQEHRNDNYITFQLDSDNNVKMKFIIFRGGKLIVYHQKVSNHYDPSHLIFPLQMFMKKKPWGIHRGVKQHAKIEAH